MNECFGFQRCSVLRGNASEIMAVAGATGDAKGVESTKGAEHAFRGP